MDWDDDLEHFNSPGAPSDSEYEEINCCITECNNVFSSSDRDCSVFRKLCAECKAKDKFAHESLRVRFLAVQLFCILLFIQFDDIADGKNAEISSSNDVAKIEEEGSGKVVLKEAGSVSF